MKKHRKIIIDCDNTFGVSRCDVDDGLAILYTLAQKNAKVLGITTTFGNNSLAVVHPNTVSFMQDIGCSDIPVYKGEETSCENNAAAKFLVDMANEYPRALSIVATGSMTNLYHAWQLDAEFYEKIDTISLMGGITAPLIINGKIMDELNFSCNAKASHNVFAYGKEIMVATGNTCLDGFFTTERFERLRAGNDFEQWLYKSCRYWFDYMEEIYHGGGTYIWDILAAAALLKPELCIQDIVDISPTEESLKTGSLIGGGKIRQVIVPKIKDVDAYIAHVYNQFKIFGE